MHRSHMDKKLNQLPTWLWTNSTTLPPIYKMVWEAVREDKVRSNGMQAELLVDTNKVFPLLLTSQLPTEVLGHIWNLSNQKYAGQLTEQELYIVLALVAAAQASYTFDSLDVLHLLPFPPTPYLNIECLLNLQPVMQSNSASKYHMYINNKTELSFIGADGRCVPDIRGKTKSGQRTTGYSNTSASVGSQSGKTYSIDSKANSVSPTWEANHTFKDIKQSSRLQMDSTSSGTSLDSCDEFTEFQSAPVTTVPNIPIWDTKQGSAIGSRLANHNLGVRKSIEKTKKNTVNSKTIQTNVNPIPVNSLPPMKEHLNAGCSPDLFPKCTIRSQSKTVILKDTAIRNNDTKRNVFEETKDFKNHTLDIEHAINNKCGNNSSANRMDWVDKVQRSPIAEFGHSDLMGLQPAEDKYSALRALGQETTSLPKSEASTNNVNHSTDEFGEFVSAEQPHVAEAMKTVSEVNNFASDVLSEFDVRAAESESHSKIDFNFVADVSQSFDNLKLEETLDESSSQLGKIQKEDAISINSIDFANGVTGALTRSGSVPSLDLKSFLPSNTEEEQTCEVQAPQVVYHEWKQYMESCVLLLQVAADIFTNISSESVLQEVLNSAQGYSFLCNLAEVAAVCRRVNFSYKEMDINIVGFDDLLMDIDRIWAEMEPFYTNIPIVTELPAWPLHQGDSISCALCLTIITTGRVVYNENNYHVTCANLWLNCVNSHLPVMRHPFYSQPNLCSANNHI